jgi:CMP-N,N'-diacetyllegionaminic acid synthase
MNALGIILARAGSVGLPGKHLLPLLGRPVIEFTLDHAAAARRLTRVVVSTDCPGVRRAAERRGIPVIQRPPELATSDASVQDVLLHAMEIVERDYNFAPNSLPPSPGTPGESWGEGSARTARKSQNPHPNPLPAYQERGSDVFSADAIVVLYGNVPVRGPGVIDRALQLLESTGCDSVRSFCPVGKWHPAWMSRLEGDIVHPVQPGSIHRRQDLPPLFLHDGAVVAVSRQSMLRGKQFPADPHAFFGIDRRGITTEPGETVEVDHRRDLFWAEAVLRENQAQEEAA